jgi:hypothetical protein
MTPETLNLDIERRNSEATVLKTLWQSLIDGFCPSHQQFLVWLQLHSFTRMTFAINKAGRKYLRLQGQMDEDFLLRYTSKIANALKTEEEAPPSSPVVAA